MADKTEIRARLAFHRARLEKLRTAYLALLDGGVKSYTIDDRTLTRFDLDHLSREIKEAERMVDELASLCSGGPTRRMVGVVPRDW